MLPVWLPLVYRASFRHKQDPETHRIFAIETAPFEIEAVSEQDAPIAFEMVLGGKPLRWRLVDGVLMREVLDRRGEQPAALSDFENKPDADAMVLRSVNIGSWIDHPLAVHVDLQNDPTNRRPNYRAEIEQGRGLITTKPFWKWTEEHLEEGMARARAITAGLRTCGDRMLRPAREPLLAVIPDRRFGVVRVETLIPPLRPLSDSPCAIFSINEEDAALECAQRLAERGYLFRQEVEAPHAIAFNSKPVHQSGLSPAHGDDGSEFLQHFVRCVIADLPKTDFFAVQIESTIAYAAARRALAARGDERRRLVEDALGLIQSLDADAEVAPWHRTASAALQEASAARALVSDRAVGDDFESLPRGP